MTTDLRPKASEAAYLTTVLRRAGVLRDGRVCDVLVGRSLAKQRSLTLRLMLTYEGSAGESPPSLILKTGHTGGAGRRSYANDPEIAFYRDIVQALPARIAPRCFEAVGARDTAPWHLLLEDLTDSHLIATEHPLPPTLAQSERIVRAWAGLHAALWDDPRLGVSIGGWPDVGWERLLAGFMDRFARFLDRFGQIMSPERYRLYERLLDRTPHLLSRYRSRRNLTLIHGDAHPWNCFLPRQGEDVRLFDWESWSIDIGSTDIASMMAMLWYPDLRRRVERPLLDLYLSELQARGVRGYDRRDLDDDYRLSVLLLLFRPIGQAAIDIPPRVWWPNLERLMAAVDDLGCRDLLA